MLILHRNMQSSACFGNGSVYLKNKLTLAFMKERKEMSDEKEKTEVTESWEHRYETAKANGEDVTREDYELEPTVNGQPIGDNFLKPGDAFVKSEPFQTVLNDPIDTRLDPDYVEQLKSDKDGDATVPTGVEGETDGLNGESELDADDAETDDPSGESANDDEADEEESDESESDDESDETPER